MRVNWSPRILKQQPPVLHSEAVLHQKHARSLTMGFPGGSAGKESAHSAGDPVRFLGWEDPLAKGKAAHPRILAWRIPWTVQPVGSQRVRHD